MSMLRLVQGRYSRGMPNQADPGRASRFSVFRTGQSGAAHSVNSGNLSNSDGIVKPRTIDRTSAVICAVVDTTLATWPSCARPMHQLGLYIRIHAWQAPTTPGDEALTCMLSRIRPRRSLEGSHSTRSSVSIPLACSPCRRCSYLTSDRSTAVRNAVPRIPQILTITVRTFRERVNNALKTVVASSKRVRHAPTSRSGRPPRQSRPGDTEHGIVRRPSTAAVLHCDASPTLGDHGNAVRHIRQNSVMSCSLMCPLNRRPMQVRVRRARWFQRWPTHE